MVNLMLWGILGLFVLILLIIIIVVILKWRKGKITIELSEMNYSPGDTISGNVVLKLKKEVEANGLYVGIQGIAKSTHVGRGRRDRGISSSSDSGVIFN